MGPAARRLPTALDVVIAVVAFGGTLAVLSNGGVRAPSADDAGLGYTELDLIGILLAACSTVIFAHQIGFSPTCPD
jgi:hypothetical protein